MTKYFKVGALIVGLFLVGFFLISRDAGDVGDMKNNEGASLGATQDKNEISLNNAVDNSQGDNEGSGQTGVINSFDEDNVPLKNVVKRRIIKPFGIFIAPETSPVQPERFRGYHTGLDLEILENEKDEVVVVRALCDGLVIKKGFVAGYGGVVVQECAIDGEMVTVLYGHLKKEIFTKKIVLAKGDIIGRLGRGITSETDFERKHLHLGIHRGVSLNLRGYVSVRGELRNWLNPCTLIFCSGN